MNINIDKMDLTDLLGYAYSASHKIEWSYIYSKGSAKEFKKYFKCKNLNKFIENFQIILTKLDLCDLIEDVKNSLKNYKEEDVSIYENIDYVLFNRYYKESQTHIGKNKPKYDYDLSLLCTNM